MCSGNKTSGAQALNGGGVAGSEGRSGQGPDPVHLVDPISLLILITTLMRSSERVLSRGVIRYGLNLNKALRLQCREWILTGARVEAGDIVRSMLQ